MDAWQELLTLFRAGDTTGTIRLVSALDADTRKAIGAELPGYVAGLNRDADDWWAWRAQHRPLLMAGVACLGGAAAVTSWMFRREFRWEGDDDAVLGLLRERPQPWQADAARRISDRLRLPDLSHWAVAAALVRETGIEPPVSDAFMVGWLRALSPLTAHRDPLFATLGPLIFEVDSLDEALPHQVDTIVRLVDDGLLKRAAAIDGVVERLLRDGPSALPTLVTVHDRLAPDLGETAERARDYARMLPAAPTPVADMALVRLRLLEAAGQLEESLFAESLEALAFRPEKKLLRAAVSWAADAVERVPERVDTALRAMSVIFAQDTLALQTLAVRLAVKLGARAGEPGKEAVREAAAELPTELREKIAAAYGGGIAEAETVVPVLVAGDVAQFPPPIGSPEELVHELSTVRRLLDAVTFERLLAGLAEWSHRAPDALREALLPWWQPLEPHEFGYYNTEFDDGAITLVRRAFLAFASPQDSRRMAEGAVRRRRASGDPMDRFFWQRAFELVAPFESGVRYPVLLATPTSGTGHLDPLVLLQRLERLEAAGVEALPADLAQALLRLPREIGEPAVERAGKLTSDAGLVCATWMRGGGLADPLVTCSVLTHTGFGGYSWQSLQVELTAPAADLPEPIRLLWTTDSHHHGYNLTWWPLALPSHRELVAAHLARCLPSSMDSTDGQLGVLPILVHGDGPLGAATAHALACGMGHADPGQRTAATDALLTLAARGEVPVEALGEAVTELVVADFLKLNRVVTVLDDATQAGAQETMWALIARILPGLLPQDGERPRAGLADLLAAGARAAKLAGVRADLPEIAAIAARKGSTRLVQEARRLHQLIAG